MSLSIKQLQAFIHVAQSQNFAQAAHKMHLSQPALSSAIKKCEEQLGGALFLRTTRQVTLTQEGRLFLPKALRLLQNYQEVIHDTQAIFEKQHGSLHIACIPSFAEARLIDLITPFVETYPALTIKVEDVVVEQVMESVLHDRAEIGIMFAPTYHEDVLFHPLFTDDFMLVMPPSHRFAQRENVHLSEIDGEAFVSMNQHANLRIFIDDILQDEQVHVRYVAEASQIATMANFVKAGLGMAILPSLSKTHLLRLGLVCKPLAHPSLKRELGLIKKRQANISVAAQAFWDMSLATAPPR
jgi:LysR family carnitine catabolism transcriptional activator